MIKGEELFKNYQVASREHFFYKVKIKIVNTYWSRVNND